MQTTTKGRKVNAAGIALIKFYEKLVLKPYICPAGVPTIGYGCTYYEGGVRVKMTDKPITKERADQLFANVLKGFETLADLAIKSPVTDNQFSAFVSLLFNCGPGKAGVKSGVINLKAGGPSTVLRLINANPNDPKITAAFAAWCSPGTDFENGLKKRRAKEAVLYFTK